MKLHDQSFDVIVAPPANAMRSNRTPPSWRPAGLVPVFERAPAIRRQSARTTAAACPATTTSANTQSHSQEPEEPDT